MVDEYNAADDESVLSSIMISLGGGLNSAYRGAQGLFARATGDQDRLAALDQAAQDQDYSMAGLREQHPIATTAGDFLSDTVLAAPLGLAGMSVKAILAAKAASKAGKTAAVSGEVSRSIRAALSTEAPPIVLDRLKTQTLKSGDLGRRSYTDEGKKAWAAIQKQVAAEIKNDPAARRALERDRKLETIFGSGRQKID